MNKPQATLRAENLSYAYPQHGLGLPTVDFEAYPGEMWAITGRSGCGKSTFARCLTGLIPHLYIGNMRGNVWIGDLNTRQAPLWRLCESVGMLFQNPMAQSLASSVEQEVLFGLENLDLPIAEQHARCHEYLERFRLLPLARQRPDTLSGGEIQRLMLAAVLARRPRAMVLDEPLSMLDTTAATELTSYLGELAAQGTTIVACEHRADYFVSLPRLQQMRLSADGDQEAAPSLPPTPVLPASEVKIRGLRLGFGQRVLFRDLTLSLRGGEVVALIGRNGVGKTTLLRALARLHPYEGTIEARDGQTVQFGLMFQNPDWQLFNPTVREEIRYRISNPNERLYGWVLQALSLGAYEQTQPLLLSEGQKKRLALATLLLRQPRDGILLDEPTLGQGDEHRAILGQVARGLANAGSIVVAATHDLLWAVCYADRIILLAPGHIAADGPTQAVLRDHAAWAKSGLVIPPWILQAT